MIVIRLKGGLGNQMFQYAFASILAKDNPNTLKIDTQFFEESKKLDGITARDLELNIFNVHLKQATVNDIKSFKELSFYSKVKRKLGLNYPKKYNEISSLFQKDTHLLKSPVYINGYFQSYKYYLKHEQFIRGQFAFSEDLLDEKNTELLLNLKHLNSISVHIRRGDYVEVDSVKKTYGVCDLNYYMKAIDLLMAKNHDATLVFFSDDSTWVKQTFSDLKHDKIIVDYNGGENSWKDMMLMSNCKHNIIANSSFSWWAAWLNEYTDKVVIAPKNWYLASKKERSTKDLIPDEWIRL